MAAHPKCDGLQNQRAGVGPQFFSPVFGGVKYFKQVVSIYLNRLNAIPNAFVDELLTTKLFIGRCAEAISVVFYQKYYWQLPHGSHIECFVKIAFRGAAIAGKCH